MNQSQIESMIQFRKEQLSTEEFSSQMNKIKQAIHDVYASIEKPIEYCTLEPVTLKGRLDVMQVLNQFNLTNLVEFHDNKTYNNNTKLKGCRQVKKHVHNII